MPYQGSSPIFSSFANDADMAELVAEFVSRLQDRVRGIQDAFQADNVSELARLAHQLKGACGGYGFAVIGDAAAELEQVAKAAQSAGEARQQIEDLVVLCHRASAGKPL